MGVTPGPHRPWHPETEAVEGDVIHAMDPCVGRVVHCDWGTAPKKRRMAIADRCVDGSWRAHPVALVGALDTLLERARAGVSDDQSVLIGFDFPIGVPVAYARAVGASSFVDLLARLQSEGRSEFFEVCRVPAEISPARPFYPRNGSPKGSTSRARHYDALGLSRDDLLRECDRRTGAEVLFWTLGPKQVGRGALIGWRDVLAPNLSALRVWPFHGALRDLLVPGAAVVAETYPAAFYRQLGVDVVKSDRASRARTTSRLLAWASANRVDLAPTLHADLASGFRTDDEFDAAIGLFGMIDILHGNHAEGGLSTEAGQVEGWILGAHAPARRTPAMKG